MRKTIGFLVLAGALIAVWSAPFSNAQQRSLTVIAHDSFNLSKTLVRAFEKREGIQLRFVKGGDAGAMVNRLILTKNAPIADAVFGIDNTLLERALKANLLEAYKPKAVSTINPAYLLDSQWRITPVNYGFVALNYDKAWFAAKGLALPQTLQDLTKPEYKGLLVAPNPNTSSPGLAFLLATIKTFGESRALEFWRQLRDNDLKITPGWDAAYYTDFTKNGGTRPIVVSYTSSPAAEVFYSKEKLTEAPTANLLLPGSSFLQIEGVGVLKGAKNRDLARKFVDFMLQKDVQTDITTQMWVYPSVINLVLPDIFKFAQRPTTAQISKLEPRTIEANAKRWTSAWTQVMR
jgi:thiamine transport system substrate-binding protein